MANHLRGTTFARSILRSMNLVKVRDDHGFVFADEQCVLLVK